MQKRSESQQLILPRPATSTKMVTPVKYWEESQQLTPSNRSQLSIRNQVLKANKAKYLLHTQQMQSPSNSMTLKSRKAPVARQSGRLSAAANRQGTFSPARSVKSTNDLFPHTFSHDQIKVCIRLRPVLPPQESDIAWRVENNGNSIVSMVAHEFDRDSNADSSSYSNALRMINLGPNIRERELKRRLNEIQKDQEFHFDQCYGPQVGTP